jgi:transposase
MKNGSARLGYKPEHAVYLDTGVIVAAPIHSADQGDTNTLEPTLNAAVQTLASVVLAPTCNHPCDLVADKSCHSGGIVGKLDGHVWKTRMSELNRPTGFCAGTLTRQQKGCRRQLSHLMPKGDGQARRDGRARLRLRPRPRRYSPRMAAWAREPLQTYLIHVASFNLGIFMRALFGCGVPREAASAAPVVLFVFQIENMLPFFAFAARAGNENAALLCASSTDVG